LRDSTVEAVGRSVWALRRDAEPPAARRVGIRPGRRGGEAVEKGVNGKAESLVPHGELTQFPLNAIRKTCRTQLLFGSALAKVDIEPND
jgi:hypothetical protein